MKSTNLGSSTSFSIRLFSLKFCSRTASMTSNSMSPNTPSGLGPGSFRERSGCNKHSWLEDPILHRSFKKEPKKACCQQLLISNLPLLEGNVLYKRCVFECDAYSNYFLQMLFFLISPPSPLFQAAVSQYFVRRDSPGSLSRTTPSMTMVQF